MPRKAHQKTKAYEARNAAPPKRQSSKAKHTTSQEIQKKDLRSEKTFPRLSGRPSCCLEYRRQKTEGYGPSSWCHQRWAQCNSCRIQKLFAEQGALEFCRIDQDNFGRSMMTGTILYHSKDSAHNAIQNLNRTKILNSMITVEYFKRLPKSEGKPDVPRNKPIKKPFKKRFDKNWSMRLFSSIEAGDLRLFHELYNSIFRTLLIFGKLKFWRAVNWYFQFWMALNDPSLSRETFNAIAIQLICIVSQLD